MEDKHLYIADEYDNYDCLNIEEHLWYFIMNGKEDESTVFKLPVNLNMLISNLDY